MHRTQNYWSINNAQHDSGSESTPLLSSGSHDSMEPVIFQDSETSDLDCSPTDNYSRYGSVEAGSFRSVSTVIPKRLPPLMQDNTLVTSPSDKLMRPTGIRQDEACYNIPNIDMILDNTKYGTNCKQPHVKDYSSNSLCKDTKPKQSSLVTIFSIWNTILGSSLLTMPWGIMMAGFFPGIILILVMSGLCLYSAYCILAVHKYHGGHGIEVTDLCRIFINKWAEYIAKIFSVTVLLGATIAYWILMSNFLYNSVNFIYDGIIGVPLYPVNNNTSCMSEVLCPHKTNYNDTNLATMHERSYDLLGPIWDLYKTVPVFLGLLIFPFLNFNSPTFFTKFNSLGTASIVYLILFVLVKSTAWGINMNEIEWETSWKIQPSFAALTGMLSLSFFIHNIIITIMQNNRDQSKNGRDLSIAFLLVTVTYITIGVVFYICFPLAKSCIEDNFLNNFQKRDTLTAGARIVLLFQLFTVYPLLAYMLRIQLLSSVSKASSRTWVLLVNFILVSLCILFAAFIPYIGTIIRYTGALSGFIYVFTLPSLLYLIFLKLTKQLTWRPLLIHASIPVIGGLNLIAQFFVSDH